MSPLAELKLYFKLKPLVGQLQKDFKMKLSVNMVSQTLLTVIQILNIVSGILTPKGQAICAGVVGVIQAVISLIAHFSDPPAIAPQS